MHSSHNTLAGADKYIFFKELVQSFCTPYELRAQMRRLLFEIMYNQKICKNIPKKYEFSADLSVISIIADEKSFSVICSEWHCFVMVVLQVETLYHITSGVISFILYNQLQSPVD